MNKSMPKASPQGGLTELKRRLIFVVLALIVFRIGSYIPVPGIDPQRLSAFFNQHGSGIIGMFNMFSGGALQRFTILALGIMPYISASIIIQLLTAVTPSLAELKKEGESGQRKINQYIRYATLFLAFFQALGVSKGLASQGVTIAQMPGFTFYFVATVSLVTGTMFLMWLGEQITERGVGNGISLIIFAGIVSGLPAAIGKTFEQVREGQMQFIILLLLVALVVIVMAFVVFIERGQRRITINYAKRQVGKKIYPSQTSHLPLKINMSGVIPPIFASSIIMFPATIAQFLGQSHGWTWLSSVGVALQAGEPIYMIVFSLAVVFFCFFYTSLVFNPKDTADNLKRSGAFIPGIRPGEQTANYIDAVMSRLTLFGAFYVVLVCLLPQILVMTWNVPFYFGGTSLLIIIVVVMDFIAQIQAHLMSHQYESLMKKSGGKSGFSLLD